MRIQLIKGHKVTPHQGHLPKVNFNQNLLYQNPPLGKQN